MPLCDNIRLGYKIRMMTEQQYIVFNEVTSYAGADLFFGHSS
jgi:hypothetical protein